MRRIEIDYQNTENLINNLKLILDGLEDEQRSIKKSLSELYDLENYYVNRNQIIEELEFRERQIYKDIQSTEEIIINIDSFSKSVQETDERLAHKFKQDIKSYAKENSIEIASEFDKWLNRIQTGLDVWGTLSPGPIADGLNGIIYFLQGDIKNGLTSLAGMIPYIGDSIKGVKYLDNASDLLKLGDKVVDLKQSSKKISKATEKLNLDDIDFNIKKNVKKFTKGFDVEPKYSSLEERIKITPSKDSKNGAWLGERGQSVFISDDKRVKKYLDEQGKKGIEYKNGMPDFSEFAKAEFKIKDMTNSRSSNFYQADEMLAKEWTKSKGKKYSVEDIANWRRENNYTWHELNDLETVQLVPSKINSPVFKHLGGVGEYNIKLKKGK